MQGAADPLEALGFCGLHCGTCFLKNGRAADHATALAEELKAARFDVWGPPLAEINPKELGAFRHTRHALEVLDAWNAMRCEKPCRGGGGSTGCRIRECCKAGARAGCCECERAETCEVLGTLGPVNGRLHLDNIRRIRTVGVAAFLAESAGRKELTFYVDPSSCRPAGE